MEKNRTAHAGVDRALKLLILLRETESLSVTQVAAHLEVSASAAHRLLSALRERDFATQDSARRYRAGPELRGAERRRTVDDARIALRPSIAAVQAELDETVNLWVLEGVLVRNVDGIESTQALGIRLNAWERVPAYCSAVGKALLARFSDAEVERMHRSGLPRWPSSRMTSVSQLIEQLQQVRERGYATNLEEAIAGVCGVGVAIRSSLGGVIAGVSCAVPTVRFSGLRSRQVARTLRHAVEEMEDLLIGAGSGR